MSSGDVASEWVARLPGLSRLWAVTKGSPQICIAVLDGPVDEATVSPGGLAQSGVAEHGTHVFSIISGSSDGIIPGIAPGCRTISIPIFDADGSKTQSTCSQQRLAKAIEAAVDAGANIVNISASQQSDLLSLSTELSAQLQDAASRDTLVIAAAGNQGCACDTIPASVAGVIAVGAHGENGAPLLSSNWGLNHRTHGVLAPGSDVPGACVGGGLCRASGTSFAAAAVSGIAGLLMSVDVERGLKPSAERTRKILLASCVRPREDQIEMASMHLAGRLDVARAADLLLSSSKPISEGEVKLTTSSSVQAGSGSATPARRDNAATTIAAQSSDPQPELMQADCGCGCGGGGAKAECTCAGKPAQYVYAIGRLGVSFISQTRRDAIWRRVNGKREGDLKPISDEELKTLFADEPYQAQSVVWTLSRTEVPMYAIVPDGAFAKQAYRFLVEEWADPKVEFISLPGVLAGTVTLYDGQTVDAVIPDLRGMFSWDAKKYVEALVDARRGMMGSLGEDAAKVQIDRFLGKIFFSLRNRGLSPEERAINAAATNAFNFSPVIVEAGGEGLSLKDIGVERSPLSRPGGDYFDVLLTFFDPNDRLGHAPLRSRFTIDVADTVPVLIGEPETWYEY